MDCNLPKTEKKRVVIVGGGFGGLKTARKLNRSGYQVVLVDKNNYHQFPPLLYQVASAGLEPSSILFPFRKIFQEHRDFHFRLAEVKSVDPDRKKIVTDQGELSYDYLVLAAGTKTNFFGNEHLERNGLAMKTVEEALAMRNTLLGNFERALNCVSAEERESLLNIVIVGGGPSGVEIAGALAEMHSHILGKDYPDLDLKGMHIYLVEGGPKLLGAMSEEASAAAEKFLREMGVEIILGKHVTDYADRTVLVDGGPEIKAETVIWVSGVTANTFEGIGKDLLAKGGRITVDQYSRVKGHTDIFAVGDISSMATEDHPNGHPQLAQVAIQQGRLLADNLGRLPKGQALKPFRYRDKGTLATIGRNKAVADLKKVKMHGFLAWVIWLGVHLMSIIGVRNKLVVMINWAWYYFSYNADLRLIVRAKDKKREEKFPAPAQGTADHPTVQASERTVKASNDEAPLPNVPPEDAMHHSDLSPEELREEEGCLVEICEE